MFADNLIVKLQGIMVREVNYNCFFLNLIKIFYRISTSGNTTLIGSQTWAYQSNPHNQDTDLINQIVL